MTPLEEQLRKLLEEHGIDSTESPLYPSTDREILSEFISDLRALEASDPEIVEMLLQIARDDRKALQQSLVGTPPRMIINFVDSEGQPYRLPPAYRLPTDLPPGDYEVVCVDAKTDESGTLRQTFRFVDDTDKPFRGGTVRIDCSGELKRNIRGSDH